MKIFDLFGSIRVDTEQAEKSLAKTESGFEKVGNKLVNAGDSVSKFGGKIANAGAGLTKKVAAGAAAITGGVTAITKIAESASSAADKIDKMSQKIGVSRQAYQELDFICSQSGMSVDTLQAGMKTLVSSMDKAASGTKANVEIFEKLGVSVTKADGSLRSQEDVMWETLSALQGMTNEAEKARLASQLFGKSGTELLPLLNSASGSIEEMKQKAHDLGLVLSDDTIDAGVKLTDTMDQAKRSLSAVGTTLGAELIPYVQKGAEYVIAHMPEIRKGAKKVAEVIGEIGGEVGKVIKWFAELDDSQQKTILKMIGLAATAGPVLNIVGKTITVGGKLISGAGKVTKAIGGISKAAGLLKTIPALFNPITLAIGLVVAAGVVLYKNWDSIKEAAGLLVERVKEHWDNLKTSVSEKTDSIKEKMSDFVDEAQINERFSAIKQAYEDNGGGILGVVAAYQETQRQAWIAGYDALNALTGGKLDEIKFKIEEKIGAARDFVAGEIDKIKGFFNFEWNLPSIKLPHFSMLGSFSLNPPSVPDIDVKWYAKAMNQPVIMDKPTAFGINRAGQILAGGETGSEVVSGTNTLMGMIKEATAGNGTQEIYKAVVEAMIYVFQNYGLQLILEMDTDSDALFRKITVKNNEFKKMHGGKSALA